MAASDRFTFFTARTTDGTSAVMELKPGYRNYTLLITGVMGGATVNLQTSIDNITWGAVGSSTTVTIVGAINFAISSTYLRIILSAAGGATSVTSQGEGQPGCVVFVHLPNAPIETGVWFLGS